MSFVPARELRNHTADVLRRAEDGEEITITVHGRPVAHLVPIRPIPRHRFSREEMINVLRVSQADPQLREDLARLAGDTTDDLGPIT
ncbi:MAG: type II toxin-antitoxin system Phd/YefM family antitoxin [Propionibacteriaceae bacterium]|nr:type II toxin-antitoxin system Phd/YefM family antitoxin [Propionibacteriaceae bacterium]